MFYRNDSRIPYSGLIIFLLASLLLLPWLGETLFNSKGEPREAIVAVAMIESGDWILPLSYGCDMPFKPPMMAWIIAALAEVFNGGHVTVYLSRLPSALAAIAMIMAGFYWARQERGDRFAMIFSMVTLTCFEVFRASMACRLDMLLTAFMVGALYLFYRIHETPKRRHRAMWLWAWLLLSCATLTKGPVGALLPCMIGGAYFLFRGDRFLPAFGKFIGLAVASLLLPALWYYAAWLRGGDAFYDLMMEENLGRLTGTMSYESHVNPFYYNFITLAAGLLPWTLIFVGALFLIRRWRPAPLKPAGMLALTAVILTVGFYCIPASKRSVYLLPAYPFVCYAIATIVADAKGRRLDVMFSWFFAILAIIAPVLYVSLLIWPLPGVTLDNPQWYGYIALAVPLLCGMAWIIRRHDPCTHMMASVWALYLAYIVCIMPSVLNPRSDARLMERIPADASTQIYTYAAGHDDYRLFTLNFYYDNRLRSLPADTDTDLLPSGTIVLSPEPDDLGTLDPDFRWYRLTQRSCDFRHPLVMGVKP